MSITQSQPLTPDTAAAIAKADPVMSQNKEPGFANTYGPGANIPEGQLGFAVPAMGVGALSLYLLYQKYKQDQQDQLEQEGQPVLKTAAIDWQGVRAQLPGLHAPDILLGGAAGAGAGLLYDYVRGSEKGKRMPTALRRALIGGLIGAGGANLVGDRARRYVTNSVVPATYDADSAIDQLVPRSWQHFWDAAIKDKPSYDPEAVNKFVGGFGHSEIGHRALTARRELDRIGMGVHLHNPDTSVWQRNTEGGSAPYYSLNEKNRDYHKNLAALMLPSKLSPFSLYSPNEPAYLADTVEAGLTPEQARRYWAQNASKINGTDDAYEISGLFKNPKDHIGTAYSQTDEPTTAAQKMHDFFGSNALLGAQQIPVKSVGDGVVGAVNDRFDITPTRPDLSALREGLLGGKVLSRDWRNTTGGSDYTANRTNYQNLKSTLGRVVWDRILRHENPWVSQKFKFAPAPQTDPTAPEYALQLLKQDNTPAFSPLSRTDLGAYLSSLRGGKLELPAKPQ